VTAVEVRPESDEQPGAESREPAALRRTLLAIIAVAVLAVVAAGGFFWGSHSVDTSTGLPTTNSVDAGFARDMATHHQQAVTMAGYVRDNPSNIDVANVAYDIETEQSVEMGTMEGWLGTWGVSRTSGTPMSWMKGMHMHVSANGLMPGMATPAQMTKLLSLHGKPMDILFLQLMIHHHQGGVQMAQYAEQHATEAYVRTLAGHMLAQQNTEIVQMEQMLRSLGGSPLPPPQ
jgi:uncharacterized protein (DUF305 family)